MANLCRLYVPMAARVFQREVELFRRHGGGLRMADALQIGRAHV